MSERACWRRARATKLAIDIRSAVPTRLPEPLLSFRPSAQARQVPQRLARAEPRECVRRRPPPPERRRPASRRGLWVLAGGHCRRLKRSLLRPLPGKDSRSVSSTTGRGSDRAEAVRSLLLQDCADMSLSFAPLCRCCRRWRQRPTLASAELLVGRPQAAAAAAQASLPRTPPALRNLRASDRHADCDPARCAPGRQRIDCAAKFEGARTSFTDASAAVRQPVFLPLRSRAMSHAQ